MIIYECILITMIIVFFFSGIIFSEFSISASTERKESIFKKISGLSFLLFLVSLCSLLVLKVWLMY